MLTLGERSDAAVMGAWGALSGATVWILLYLSVLADLPTIDSSYFGIGLSIGAASLVPGFVFGLVFAILFYGRGRLRGAGLLGYVLAAGISYFVAYHVGANTFPRWHFGSE
ncbi:MAG: hypothetical protein WCF16_07395, partial [Alphaproteobacteria bacterium]